ncbi:MAG: hypothetical protein ACKOEG_12025, partial [Chthoniobacterales bacterium]
RAVRGIAGIAYRNGFNADQRLGAGITRKNTDAQERGKMECAERKGYTCPEEAHGYPRIKSVLSQSQIVLAQRFVSILSKS